MAQVFISFIHEQQDWANNLQLFLLRVLQGQADTFLSSDKNAIYAGEDWMRRILGELKEAKVLLSMLSPQSISRPWINFEAGAAWMGDAKVIPVCFGGLGVNELPKPYSNLQAVDLETFEGNYYLVSSIAHHLGLTTPEKPTFSSFPEAVMLAGRDPEKNEALLSPYKWLQGWMRLLKGVKRPE